MVEPFKNFFNTNVISQMGEYLWRVWPSFAKQDFIAFCIEEIEVRELKERSNRIVEGLEKFLPQDFGEAALILVQSLDPNTELTINSSGCDKPAEGIRGWAIMPMADYVALRGQEDVELALETLRQLTMRWSAEFAVRPFFKNHPTETLRTMERWVDDKNYHVRRLVSEGSRPRLPWGMRLHQFIKDPSAVIKLLEHFKDDESEYVRRSVANNLNDIAKDHPDLVAQIARDWMVGASKERVKLVRHALRSLIKQGHKGALEALGYGAAKIEMLGFDVTAKQISLGGALKFDLQIASTSSQMQPLIVDFIIHHQLANGKTAPKVFKWKNMNLTGGEHITMSKSHTIKPITTRRYYSGQHRIEVMVNGEVICGQSFDLAV